MTQSELFQTAVKSAKSGDHFKARALLLQLVETHPQHELAWLWLSELIEEPEDKIIALENALTINPNREQSKTRLNRLRQKMIAATLPPIEEVEDDFDNLDFSTEEEKQFDEIKQLFANGRKNKGRQQLATFLYRYANHAEGWWLMAQNADSQPNLLKCLDHLLRINPQHPKAPAIVAKIKPNKGENLMAGRLYERLEQWETAVRYYKLALKSPNNADRLLAKKRLPHLLEQVRLANIKVTNPTLTMLRLALGPTILYALLIMVQAGLNPLQASPLLCLGNIFFFGGLLLLSGLATAPTHPWMMKLRETAVLNNNTMLRIIGILFILLPILLLLFLTISRLLAFEFDPNSL